MKNLYTILILIIQVPAFAALPIENDPPVTTLLDCAAAPVVSVVQPTCSSNTGSIIITSPIGNNYEYSVDGGMTFQSGTSFLNLPADNSYPVLYRETNISCVSAMTMAVITPAPALPASPVVLSPQLYCVNATATPLIAAGSNLKWYATPTSTVGTTVAPTPSTAMVGTFNYYVSQTVNGCESLRSTVTVTILSNASLNLFCDAAQSTPTSLTFDWANISGASQYAYAYSIDGAPAISGTLSAPTHFTVSGLTSGQSVVFSVSVPGNPCVQTQAVSCSLPPLVNEGFESLAVKYYPNPVHDFFHIESDQTINHISVVNLLGQEVFGGDFNKKEAQIDFSNLSPAVYILKVDAAKGSKSIPIIKQ